MAGPIEKLREVTMKRGVNGIRMIGRTFKTYDDNGNKKIDKEELANGLRDYGLNMSGSEVDELFQYFDTDGSGSISFDEFLVALRPPMSPARLEMIEKVYNKMDVTGDGQLTLEDLKKSYDVSHHPKYKSGEKTRDELLKDFMDTFQSGPFDDVVTKEEFINYYAGVSASIDEDIYFDYMMRQVWKI